MLKVSVEEKLGGELADNRPSVACNNGTNDTLLLHIVQSCLVEHTDQRRKILLRVPTDNGISHA